MLPRLIGGDQALDRVIGRAATVLAAPETARAPAIAAIVDGTGRKPVLVATATTSEAERLTHDLGVLLGDQVVMFPAWETLPFERVSPSLETMGQRLRALWLLQTEDRCPAVVVAPVRALIQRIGPGATDVAPVSVSIGDRCDPAELVSQLVELGYRREPQVEHRGEVAMRGSIVDVYGCTQDSPVRIDLWGDEVERLTTFSVNDQRSIDDIASVEIFGCRELRVTEEVRARAEKLIASEPWGREQWERLSEGLIFDGMESWLPWLTPEEIVLADQLDSDSTVILVEPRRMRDRAADLLAEEEDLARTLAKTWSVDQGREFPRLHIEFDRLLAKTEAPVISTTPVPEGPDVAVFDSSGWDPPGEQLAARLRQQLAEGARVIVCADGVGSASRLSDILNEWGVTGLAQHGDQMPEVFSPGGHIVVQSLERGFVLPRVGVAVITEAELTGRRRSHRKAKPRKRQSEGFFEDLQRGDYIVHHQHGVGRFSGMVKRDIGGHSRDYLLLDYKGDDKLYVPSDQIDLIRRYTGGESPSLHRLGGADFSKAKAKVRSAVAEIAQELVVLYQTRMSAEGIAFAPDTPWQAEVEGAFPYELTPDQAMAVVEIKGDMEREVPMDRLVVGDVGFGKTEVALRAVFKAIQSGKQAAVLVPTTLLAQQHFQTFTDRFAPYPIRVEVLSRFLTAAQARKVVADVAAGQVDVLIGTHRILSEDIKFDKLGLLVVDEEQRFGVSHKEVIKKLRTDVDVLTLTATPIPRTLEMSLVGIRDLSLLNTPPADRQPILTYVGEYDERPVAEAIRRELLREGQVFFVHNRVRSIEKVASELRALVPEARVAVAHGQMDEGTLETIVLDFWEGKYDVLVCTTIIESGIDMPTVNTLVVDRAERLGLGQLHQLRGRVGRSGQRAYAYLFTQPDAALSEEAYERLKTIGEATELGSGFKIAMRDLEIRGAGNLLGSGQSGHIAAVGYDLYCQLVTEAVGELNGEPVKVPVEIKIDLPVDAHIPEDYIDSGPQRLGAYRRLAAVSSLEEVTDIRAEWEDRYGPIPKVAERLIEVGFLRARCSEVGITEVVVIKGPGFGGPELVAKLGPIAELKVSQEVRIDRLYKGSVWKPVEFGALGGQIQVGLKRKTDVANDLVAFLESVFDLS